MKTEFSSRRSVSLSTATNEIIRCQWERKWVHKIDESDLRRPKNRAHSSLQIKLSHKYRCQRECESPADAISKATCVLHPRDREIAETQTEKLPIAWGSVLSILRAWPSYALQRQMHLESSRRGGHRTAEILMLHWYSSSHSRPEPMWHFTQRNAILPAFQTYCWPAGWLDAICATGITSSI